MAVEGPTERPDAGRSAGLHGPLRRGRFVSNDVNLRLEVGWGEVFPKGGKECWPVKEQNKEH